MTTEPDPLLDEPPDDRPLLADARVPVVDCPMCLDGGGLHRTRDGWRALHTSNACPVRFTVVGADGRRWIAPDARGMPAEPAEPRERGAFIDDLEGRG